MNKEKLILLLFLIMMIVPYLNTITTNYSFSELYQNWDGSYWPEEVYETFVYECSILQQNGGINQNIDCADWILTQEGNERIHQYLAFKFGDIYK